MRELKTLAHGWIRFWTQPALPLVLLLSALSTVFLFGNDRGTFYRNGHHDWLTSQSMAQAVNLSPEHNFLLFIAHALDAEGEPSYVTYARWPLGGYALVKLATLPFDGNLSAQLYATRIVALLLFAGSAVLGFFALVRVTRNGWIGLTATLLAFSSYYALYYSDAFAPDAVPALFGMMLTFHGMVVFVQEGRLRQLLVKSCAALLLCWPVYALLLPFVVLGMASDLVKLRNGESVSWSLASWLKRYVMGLLFSRYLTLGVVTLLFGIAVLSFNLGAEYRAFGGETPLTKLPTIQSMESRLGASSGFDERVGKVLEWGYFLEQEFSDITRATLPFVASPFDRYRNSALSVIVGALAVGVACLGLIFVRTGNKLPLTALVLAGFCWALPLWRSVVFHDFQALFYIGVPLTTFSVILLYIRKLSSDQFLSVFSVAALLLFVLSSAEMAGVGHSPNQALIEDETMRDFEAMRGIVNDGVVLVPVGQFDRGAGETMMVSSYLLAGSVIEFDLPEGDRLPHRHPRRHPIHSPDRRQLLDYFISTQREDSPALLTPDNRRFFLYDRALYDGQYDGQSLGASIIASDWNVYLRSGSLVYVSEGSEGCANMGARFFLHVVPSDPGDLPDKRYEFAHLDFLFADHAVLESENRCVAVRELPEYAISSLRTGQYVPGEGRIWQAEVGLGE